MVLASSLIQLRQSPLFMPSSSSGRRHHTGIVIRHPIMPSSACIKPSRLHGRHLRLSSFRRRRASSHNSRRHTVIVAFYCPSSNVILMSLYHRRRHYLVILSLLCSFNRDYIAVVMSSSSDTVAIIVNVAWWALQLRHPDHLTQSRRYCHS